MDALIVEVVALTLARINNIPAREQRVEDVAAVGDLIEQFVQAERNAIRHGLEAVATDLGATLAGDMLRAIAHAVETMPR